MVPAGRRWHAGTAPLVLHFMMTWTRAVQMRMRNAKPNTTAPPPGMMMAIVSFVELIATQGGGRKPTSSNTLGAAFCVWNPPCQIRPSLIKQEAAQNTRGTLPSADTNPAKSDLTCRIMALPLPADGASCFKTTEQNTNLVLK
jgi:hypothetical protein